MYFNPHRDRLKKPRRKVTLNFILGAVSPLCKRARVFEKKEKTTKKKKGRIDSQPNKKHVYVKKKKQRERIVSKIAFFLEKQNMKERSTKYYVNEKEKECL